jgi:hypothetical protein
VRRYERSDNRHSNDFRNESPNVDNSRNRERYNRLLFEQFGKNLKKVKNAPFGGFFSNTFRR